MRRQIGLDFLKIISCFAVVGLHTIGRDSSEVNRLVYYLCGFAIPIFFLTHGYFLLNKKDLSVSYLFKKGARYLCIALCWNLFIGGLVFLISEEVLNPFFETAKELFWQKGFFFQFWFFGSLILLYIIMPILKKIKDSSYDTTLKILFIVLLIIDVMSLTYCSFTGIPFQKYIRQPFRMWTWIFYFLLGGTLKDQKFDKLKKYIKNNQLKIFITVLFINLLFDYLIGYCVCGVYWAEYFYDNIFMIIEVVVLFIIFENFKFRKENYNILITKISSLTMGVFIVHIIFVKFIDLFYDYSNPVLNFLVWSFVFLGSLGVCMIIKKIPIINKMISV